MSSLHAFLFFFSSRRRHTRLQGDWSSDVCSSDLSVYAAVLKKGDKSPVEPQSDEEKAGEEKKDEGDKGKDADKGKEGQKGKEGEKKEEAVKGRMNLDRQWARDLVQLV